MKPERGIVLISEPFLPDPNFSRAVVLLVDHEPSGTVGFVLNRPLGLFSDEILESFPGKFPIMEGGPVSTDTLHFIHCYPDIPGSVKVMDNLFWSGDFETLKEGIADGRYSSECVRLFAGYSGWAGGQLEAEIDTKSWILARSNSSVLLSNDPELWKTILKSMGGQNQWLAQAPPHPQFN